MDEINRELAEFEALVDDIRGDCDKCKGDCRDRLLIMDGQLQALTETADRLEDILRDYKAHCRVCAQLNLLCRVEGQYDAADFVARFLD